MTTEIQTWLLTYVHPIRHVNLLHMNGYAMDYSHGVYSRSTSPPSLSLRPSNLLVAPHHLHCHWDPYRSPSEYHTTYMQFCAEQEVVLQHTICISIHRLQQCAIDPVKAPFQNPGSALVKMSSAHYSLSETLQKSISESNRQFIITLCFLL